VKEKFQEVNCLSKNMTDFDKSDFRKGALAPSCQTCGARTRGRTPDNLYWLCKICDHPVDDDGNCKSSRRCVSCNGKPKCENCGRMSEEVSGDGFRCNTCNHSLDDDGYCNDSPCYTCNPYTCNECDSTLEGGLDDEGEIHCGNCDHYVDSSGDCMSGQRGHCDTCDTYPDCPSCGADTYHEWNDDEERSEYYCEDDCEHRLDYDGECCDSPCSDCGTECDSCGAKTECNNGPSCSYEREGNCRFCHCNDSYLPDCPDCGDNQDVEGPDSDGDFWCNYEECDSSNYFS